MDWTRTKVAPERTHHTVQGQALYEERFDAVIEFYEPGLAPVMLNKEAWHINLKGKPVYSRRFHQTFGFYQGRAAVSDSTGWYHIFPDGQDVYEDRYSWCGNYQEDWCPVRDQDGLYRHLDLQGRPAYSQRWNYAGDVREGIAVVQHSDGYSTHIGQDGQQVHGYWFEEADVYHKGFARARDSGGWMHIDLSGQPAYSHRFASVEPFYNGQARVERSDGGVEIIDSQGHTLCEVRHQSLLRTHNFGYVDKDASPPWSSSKRSTSTDTLSR